MVRQRGGYKVEKKGTLNEQLIMKKDVKRKRKKYDENENKNVQDNRKKTERKKKKKKLEHC